MRIRIVINGLDFGGTESALEQLATGLATRGHDVRVLVVKRPGRTAERLRLRGIDVTTLGMSDVVSSTSMLIAVWRMRRLLRCERIDLVHSFLPRANIISRLANRLSGARVPHVSSERSTDFRRSPTVRWLNQHTARWTDLVLAVSPMVRDVLIARDCLPREKIAVLENGIDLRVVDAAPAAELRRELPALAPGRLIFCSVGRFVPEKGFAHLVRAFARMRQRDAAQVLLVGEGPLEPAVREEARALGVAQHVVFAGFRENVLGMLKGADAYVLSSVEEGSPMVLLEAMACSLPIVATNVSGVRELVGPEGPSCAAIVVPPPEEWRNGSSAIRADASSVERMAAAMDRLARDAEARRELAATARRRIEEAFSLERMIERLERHYLALPRHG